MEMQLWAHSIALGLAINGQNLDAHYLTSDLTACDARDRVAAAWRKASSDPIHQARVQGWCVVARIRDGHWEAQQWRDGAQVEGAQLQGTPNLKPPAGGQPKSHGWSVRFPLAKFPVPSPGQPLTVGVGPRAELMTVLPSQMASVWSAHRDELARRGFKPEQSSPPSADPPFLVTRQRIGRQAMTLVTVRLENGQVQSSLLQEPQP